MRTEQCISVTELAKNTSGIIRRASEMGVQYVFVNNKPQAVILDMRMYEAFEKGMVEFGFIKREELNLETLAMYDQAKKVPKEEFIDL